MEDPMVEMNPMVIPNGDKGANEEKGTNGANEEKGANGGSKGANGEQGTNVSNEEPSSDSSSKGSFSSLIFPRDQRKSMRATLLIISQFHSPEICLDCILFLVVMSCVFNNIPIYTVHDHFITNTLNAKKIPNLYTDCLINMLGPLYHVNRLIYDNLLDESTSSIFDPNSKYVFLNDTLILNHFHDKIIDPDDFLSIYNHIKPQNLSKSQNPTWEKHFPNLMKTDTDWIINVSQINGYPTCLKDHGIHHNYQRKWKQLKDGLKETQTFCHAFWIGKVGIIKNSLFIHSIDVVMEWM
jgi:hypothetical protein